ncbi:MAG: protein translocase subunit SecF [Hyphomonadaceae bacterium]|nr:MAG: SecD/SecF fusion protein [Caulobacteraceae bacterium]MBT9447755.1 protein translocase subunit SecF [Hyphomonadaceae bacterium]TPW02723.1 MAG: SecD/SecF fusion protein [Alphaproteobacteria bacterium]
MWPFCKLIPAKTNFKFVRFAGFAAFLSIAAVSATFASILTAGFTQNPIAIYQATSGSPQQKMDVIFSKSFNLGIDFKGGNSIELSAPATIDLEKVRASVLALDLGDVQVQGFSDDKHAEVRFETPTGREPAAVNTQLMEQLKTVVPGITFENVQVVGPKVSSELFTGGVLALGLAILLMLIYIWFRFEWQFGLGAVMALFHDVILTLGIFSVFRIEFTLTIIAALLTIIGYSMNDTVVVFDRLRENLRKYKKMPLSQVIDTSTNETLSRTIVTGMTALMALTGLLVVGGEAMQGFSIAMLFGIVIGTYSSVYVAAPAILLWGVNRGSMAQEKPDRSEHALP